MPAAGGIVNREPARSKRVAIEKGAEVLAVVVGCVSVELAGAAANRQNEVGHQAEVVADFGIAPTKGRIRHVRPPGVGVCLPARGLLRPDGGAAVLELSAQGKAARIAHPKSGDAGYSNGFAVTLVVLAGLHRDAPHGGVVVQSEIDDAGDGVGPVLRRGPVAQHFHRIQRDRRDVRDVRPLRAAIDAAREIWNVRGAVPAFPIDEHQRLVCPQTAQVRWPHQAGSAAQRVGGNREGRHQRAQYVLGVHRALVLKVLRRQHVHGGGDVGDRTDESPGADYHDLFNFADLGRGVVRLGKARRVMRRKPSQCGQQQ